ncbi:hypothetical protein MT325_m648L [Paramecium bursaria chlorella virus MT325]|uniref:Uncharacterized protein m648L n=1 Tax=Paramecium bursaria Chlorella virus MT325 TaxID=346932 RepID=A7IV28_PBCVM|nr:hypothetical protein MT325_m648L [Paramecium bursaria chlorella virus MT325]
MLFFLMLTITLESTAPPFLNVRGILMIFSDLFNNLVSLFSNLMMGISTCTESVTIPLLDGLSLASTFDFHNCAYFFDTVSVLPIFPLRLLPTLLVVMDFGVNTLRSLVLPTLTVFVTGLLLLILLPPPPPPTSMVLTRGDDFGVNSFLTYTFLTFLPPSPFTYVRPFVSVNTRRPFASTLPVFDTGLLVVDDDIGGNSLLTKPNMSANTRRSFAFTLPVYVSI